MNALPDAVLRQHIAFLGKTGSGKTSTAKLAVEQVIRDNPAARVCVTGCAPGLLAAIARGATSWEHAAVLAGIIPGNGYFYKGRKALVDGGWVMDGAPLALTGMAMRSIEPQAAPKLSDLVALWSSKLRSPVDQILQQLAAKPDRTVGTEDLAAATGIKPGNGYWYKGVKAARDANLIEQDKGTFRLSDFLRNAPR